MSSPQRSQSTKEAILEQACKIFAEKGYRGATHAEICSAAGANVASINYYFGSKEKLYEAAFILLTERMEERHPLDGGVPSEAPAEERLRAFVHAHLRRLFDPDLVGGRYRIHMLEITEPTGLLESILSEELARARALLQDILRSIVGDTLSQRDVEWCELSIIGQCFMAIPNRDPGGGPRKVFRLDVTSVDALTDHIVSFSLAGVREIHRKRQKEGE